MSVLWSAGGIVLFVNEGFWAALSSRNSNLSPLATTGGYLSALVALLLFQHFFLGWVRLGIRVDSHLSPFVFSKINLGIFSMWCLLRFALAVCEEHGSRANGPATPQEAEATTASVRVLQSVVAFERQKNFYFKRIIRERLHFYDSELRRAQHRVETSRMSNFVQPQRATALCTRPTELSRRRSHTRHDSPVPPSIEIHPFLEKWSTRHRHRVLDESTQQWVSSSGTLKSRTLQASPFERSSNAGALSRAGRNTDPALSAESSARTLVDHECDGALSTRKPVLSSHHMPCTFTRLHRLLCLPARAIEAPLRAARNTWHIVERIHFNCLILCGYLWVQACTYIIFREREELRPLHLVGNA